MRNLVSGVLGSSEFFLKSATNWLVLGQIKKVDDDLKGFQCRISACIHRIKVSQWEHTHTHKYIYTRTNMAHRILVQVVFTGAKVFGKAFTEAYRQAAAATTAQKATGGNQANAGSRTRDGDIALDEACKILDVERAGLSLETAQKKYDYLFDINSKEKGGSFYIQSKVFRAMERIQNEMKAVEEMQKEKKKEGSDSTDNKGSPP